jgi:hypothetical protein
MTTQTDLGQMGEERDRLPMGIPALEGERVIFETRGWFAPWLWIIYLIIPAFLVWPCTRSGSSASTSA